MSDNVVANAGSGGSTFATDDIGGIHYPRSKIVWGADGTVNEIDGTAGKGLPVTLVADKPTITDRSSLITTGGTAQQLMASNSSRKGWWVQNTSSGDLWVDDLGNSAVVATTGAGNQKSIRLVPGSFYRSEQDATSTTTISIIGATTSQTFASREW